MPSAERGAPERDSLGIDLCEAARIVDGRRVVFELIGDPDQLPRRTTARTEVPVVEREHGKAGVAEANRVGLEAGVFGAPQSMRHDDAWNGM